MADYWKSQPRKFCQYCKCWIADNKPSVDFHERGKNHKENVAAKIAEIKKKSVQKAKQEKKMCKQFAAMEEAAAKAYEEDLKRMGIQGSTSFGPEVDPTSTTPTYQPEPTEQPQKQPQTNKQGPKQGPKPKPPEPKPPVELPPHPQYPPHLPHPQHIPQHVPQRTEPALWVEAMSTDGHIYYYNRLSGESRWDKPQGFKGINDAPPPPGTTEISTVCAWMEAVSPEGHTYYYNTVTRASSWEKPADYIPKAVPSEQGEGQGEPPNTEKEEEAAAEEAEEEATSEQPSTGTTEDEGQHPTVPKVQFRRKRKAEADSSEETSEAAEDIPEEGEKDQSEESGTTESEMKEEKEDETPAGRFRPRNPYGTWERIKVQKDPYTSVDWQLPQVQAVEDTVLELPPEPKHKFKTRVITSLGDGVGSSGPVSFKKKKTQNGKSRSLRQRDEDD